MKPLNALLVMTTLITSASAATVNFDDAKVGEAPAGWTATNTGKRRSEVDS